MTEIEHRIKKILEQLEQTNEDLLALADDVWLSIDHNDNEAIQKGVAFKTEYNEKVTSFDKLSGSISNLVQDYMGLSLEKEETATTDSSENKRIVKELDTRKRHYLDEDFRYKKPIGFSIEGKGFNNVRKWKRIYVLTLSYLHESKRKYSEILTDEKFVSNRGNKDFSRNPSELRSAIKINGGIYAESNLSANQIRDRLIKLLSFFNIDKNDFVIYLREDRDFKSDN